PVGFEDFPVCLPSLHRSTEISHVCYRGWLYLSLGDLSSELHIHRISTLPTKSSPYPFVLVPLNIGNSSNSSLVSSTAHCSKQCCVVLSQKYVCVFLRPV
ncbi:mCG144878, partial [Mus musculus]